jgi:predicted methyltransferase
VGGGPGVRFTSKGMKRGLVMREALSSVHLRVFLSAVVAVVLMGCAVGVERATDVAAPPPDQGARAQPAPAPDPEADKVDRPTSDPYKGDLSIFEEKGRAEKLQIDRVMDLLDIKEGSSVADIGAGSGWFTVRAARRVGEGGSVYAVEINKKYLEHIEDRARRENLPNVRPVLGREDDPLLAKGSVDAVLLLKTYHEIAQPVVLMRHVREAMRPGARLGVIDRDGDGDDHGIDGAKVIEEVERAGFKLVAQHDLVKPDDMDYFLVFEPKPE